MDKPGIEQRGPNRHVVVGCLYGLINRAHRVPDLITKVPEVMQNGFDDAFGVRRLFVREKKEQIDIRSGSHKAPAIPARCDQRHRLGGGRLQRMVNMEDGKIVDKLNKLILKQGKGLGTGAAVSGLLEKALRIALGLSFQGLEPSQNARTHLIRTADFHPKKR